MSTITSANLANAIVKLVAADALPALMSNLVMGNLVNRDYEPVLAHAGDTVNVPIPPTLVANNIVEGGSVQAQNPNLGNAQIVLNTHAEATFQIPDVTKCLAVPDLMKVYIQPAVVAIAERIESDLLNLYSQFTANTPVGSAGTPVTESVIDAAETALFRPRCRRARRSIWWLIRTPIRRSGRYLVSASITRLVKRVEGPCGRRGRQDERLFHLPFAISCQERHQSREYAQPRIQPRTRWAWWFAACPNLCPAPARWPSTPRWGISVFA